MINWIDILSPKLRNLHRDWIHFRGTHLMPAVADYNAFASSEGIEQAANFSACVILPAEGSPVFKHVGQGMGTIMPGCGPGVKFTDIPSPMLRSAITGPFHRIVTSRQPEVRRRRGNTDRDFEMLLLPFSDSRLRVCIIHAIVDLAGIDWKRAFA